MTAALFLQKCPQMEKRNSRICTHEKNTEMMGEMFQIFFDVNKQFLNN